MTTENQTKDFERERKVPSCLVQRGKPVSCEKWDEHIKQRNRVIPAGGYYQILCGIKSEDLGKYGSYEMAELGIYNNDIIEIDAPLNTTLPILRSIQGVTFVRSDPPIYEGAKEKKLFDYIQEGEKIAEMRVYAGDISGNRIIGDSILPGLETVVMLHPHRQEDSERSPEQESFGEILILREIMKGCFDNRIQFRFYLNNSYCFENKGATGPEDLGGLCAGAALYSPSQEKNE